MNDTQVSWKRTLGVFNARLANIPPERGTKLRGWKETVAGVYSDFEAKLSDDRPVILSLQEVSGTAVPKDRDTQI